MGRTIGANAVNDFSLITGSKISLSQLFANVNTGDNKFLSEEQVAIKRTAQEADYTKYGRSSQLAAAHAVEIIQVSDFNGTNSTHNHQWLDENGWEYRTVHLIDKSGNIYSATLNIGLAKDGRKILYDINKISNIGHGVVPSASKKKRGSHINPDIADKSIVSRPDTDVKQKFSLSDPLNAAFNQDVQDKFEKDVDDVLNGKYTSDDPLMLGTTQQFSDKSG